MATSVELWFDPEPGEAARVAGGELAVDPAGRWRIVGVNDAASILGDLAGSGATYERTTYQYDDRCRECGNTWTGSGSRERRVS